MVLQNFYGTLIHAMQVLMYLMMQHAIPECIVIDINFIANIDFQLK